MTGDVSSKPVADRGDGSDTVPLVRTFIAIEMMQALPGPVARVVS